LDFFRNLYFFYLLFPFLDCEDPICKIYVFQNLKVGNFIFFYYFFYVCYVGDKKRINFVIFVVDWKKLGLALAEVF